MDYDFLFENHKASSLFGRYITLESIEPLVKKHAFDVVGSSVLGKPIYRIQIGAGPTKILMWSQMHGNESTTTKAVFDFLELLTSGDELGTSLLEKYTFCILPMVNPDGAFLYTRANANAVDLNRDSVDLSQPESTVLRKVFDAFQPNYGFNLHDQRSIFGVSDTGKPATVSFLAPSFDESKSYNVTRTKAVKWIETMHATLEKYIPGQIGRFDDGFNINCIGDRFQSLGVPTILFEAGHFHDDYEREITRKMIFISLVSGLLNYDENDVVFNDLSVYLQIPQNKIIFYDILIKNIEINYDGIEKITNIALQFKEELVEGNLHFVAFIAKIGELDSFFFHATYDVDGSKYSDLKGHFPVVDDKASFLVDSNWFFKDGFKI